MAGEWKPSRKPEAGSRKLEAGCGIRRRVSSYRQNGTSTTEPEDGGGASKVRKRLARALDSAGPEQRAQLRKLGDVSLFTSGFFSDSLQRAANDVEYYVSMGEYAYGSLSRRDEDAFAEVFGELARKFVGFTDVLADISERTALSSAPDVLRLYEKWLRTGSERDGQRLIERGVLPNSSIGTKFLQ